MPAGSAYAEFSSALQTLLTAAETTGPAPVYCFLGADEFLVSQSARVLAYRLIPAERRPLQLTWASWDDEGRAALQEFMASRSLFVLPEERSVLVLADPPTAAGQGDFEEFLRALGAGPPPGNILVLIVRQELSERHPLRQTVSRVGVAVPVPELRTAGDRRNFIRRRLTHEALRASPAVVQQLDWLVGNNSRGAAQEAHKLALYLYPDNTIKLQDLEMVVSPTAEVRAYELADAVAQAECAQVLRLVGRLREAGTEPLAVVNQLCRGMRRLLQARLLLDRSLVDARALAGGADAFARWLEGASASLSPMLPEDPSENLLAQSRYAVYRQFLAARNTTAAALTQAVQALLHAEVLLKSTTYLIAWDAVTEVALCTAARARPPILSLFA